jgi:hypothetical protein
MNTLLVLFSAALSAASPRVAADDGWLAFQGCWHAEGDAADRAVCVLPDAEGARLINVIGNAIQSETRIIADGKAREINQEGCRGTQQAHWSKDRQRVLLSADMTCGEQTRRKVTGIMSMHSAMQWLSVEAVSSGAEQMYTRTKSYSEMDSSKMPESIRNALRANRLASETARYSAIALLDLEDVQEATRAAGEDAVVEWITAVNQTFDLNGKRLLALADAGVPASVIEALVAVSNPQYFAVQTVSDRDDYRGRGRGPRDPCLSFTNDYWGIGYGFPYNYDRYRYSSRGYYDSCTGRPYYTPWGYYDPYGWRGRGTTVIIVRGDGDGDGSSGNAAPNARVTRKGYSAGRPSSDTPPSTTSSTTRTTSSGTNSGDASAGSSSSGSTRTAKPKDHN